MDRRRFIKTAAAAGLAVGVNPGVATRPVPLPRRRLARGSWPEDAECHHAPCWYEPVTDPEEAALALGFALSQGATAAVPPGNQELFWKAVDAAGSLRPLDRAAEQRLRYLTSDAIPLFRYSS